MSRRNSVANLVIYALAIIGLIVVAPGILSATMGLTGLIIRLLAWMVAGVLAGRFMRGKGYGPIGDIGLGIVGGIVGSWLFGLLGLGWLGNGIIMQVFVGAVGAVVFIYIARIFDRDFAK